MPEQIAADKRPYHEALYAADLTLASGALDLGALETLLDAHLATQLLSACDDAKNPEAGAFKDRKLH